MRRQEIEVPPLLPFNLVNFSGQQTGKTWTCLIFNLDNCFVDSLIPIFIILGTTMNLGYLRHMNKVLEHIKCSTIKFAKGF